MKKLFTNVGFLATKRWVLAAVLPLLLTQAVKAGSGIFESYAVVNGTFYDLSAVTANTDFQGASLGTFATNATFTLNGQVKTFKNGSDNICGGRIKYAFYPTAGTVGAFSNINLGFLSNVGNDQTWQNGTATTITLPTTPGSYKMAVYVTDQGDASSGCTLDPFHTIDNNGAYYVANITICGTGTGALPAGSYGVGTGQCFTTVAAAVGYININGVSGPVVFNVAAGHTESAPAGGISITATGTAANTITFQKSGSGANPIVTATTIQTTSSLLDAVVKIVGGDYITFDGIDVSEASGAATVTASNTATEFGYALFYASITNGAQNNTIKNCNITMKSAYANSIGIYSSTRHTSTSSTSADVSLATGANSNLKIYGNTISNVNLGIVVVSSNTAAAGQDTGLDIGGTATSTANTITFGSTATNALGISGISGTFYGILVVNVAGYNVSYNTINSNNVTYGSAMRGIYVNTATSPIGTLTNTINNNTIALNTTATTSTSTAIELTSLASNATTTININNNAVIGVNGGATSSNAFTGIINSGPAATLNINTNNFTYSTAASATGAVSFINTQNSTSSVGTLSVDGNKFYSAGSGIQSTGAMTFISSHTTTTSKTINNNDIQTGFTRTGASGAVIFYTNASGASAAATPVTVTNNDAINLSLSGTSSFTGFTDGDGTGAYPNKTYSTNAVGVSGSASGAFIGMNIGFCSATNQFNGNTITFTNSSTSNTGIKTNTSGTSPLIYGNTISMTTGATVATVNVGVDLANALVGTEVYSNTISISAASVTGAVVPTVIGIRSASGTNNRIYLNNISNLVAGASSCTASALLYGVHVSAGTTAVFIYKNRIFNLVANSTGAATVVKGINVSAGPSPSIYNNFVSDLRMPNAAAGSHIIGIDLIQTGTTNSIFFNTVNLTPAVLVSGTFVSGIEYPNSASTPTTLKNNIINVTSSGTTTGLAALRRVGGTSGTKPVNLIASNNIYYASGGASANYYAEGTATLVNNYNATNDPNFNSSIGAYKTFMGSSDVNSYQENNLVAGGTIGTFTPSTSVVSFAESGGIAITTPLSITDDFSSGTRTSPPDMGALEFAGMALVQPVINSLATNITGTQCVATARIVTANITSGNALNSVNLFYSVNGGTATLVAMTGNLAASTTSNFTGTIPAATPTNATITWYVAVTSNPITVISNGTAYADDPMLTYTLATTATPSTICSGANSQLLATGSQPFTTSVASAYSFAGSSSTYTTVTGTTVTPASTDDSGNGNLPIGFTFNYNGADFTVFGMRTNGLIELGQTMVALSAFSSNVLAANPNCIAPLWDDNNMVGGTMIYTTTGTAPNRVLTVQWTNMHVGGTGGTAQPTISTQVQLFETTNVVKLNYGATSAALTSTTASIGISGASGNYRSVTPGSPASASTSSSATENTAISSATNFPTGTVYTFTPGNAPIYTYAWTPTTFIPSGQETTTNPLATALTATTNYTFTVTGTAGCTKSSSVAVTVNALPTISGTLTVCAGSTTTLTGSGTAAASTPYVSATPSVATVTSGGVVTGVAAGTSVITYTNNNGCTVTATVTVNATPSTPSVTAGSATTFCTGGSVTLTSNAATGNQWYRDGTLISGQTATTYSATTSGTYTVISTISSCPSAASSGTTVTVNALTATSVTITSNPSGAICAGTSVTFTATPTGGGTPTYAWKLNGTTVSTIATYTSAALVNMDGIAVEMTSSAVCPSPTVATASLVMTVNPLPTAPSVSSTVQPTCTVATGTVTLTTVVGETYNVDGGTFQSSGVFAGLAAGAHAFIAKNAAGCVSTATSETINAQPTLPVVAAITGASTVCASATITLADATSGGVWSSATTSVATVDPSTGVVTGVAAGTSVISYAVTNSCGTTTVTTTVTVNGATAITTQPTDKTVSVGATLTLSVVATGANLMYQWKKAGVDISGETAATLTKTATASDAGSYTVVVTGDCGVVTSLAAVVTISGVSVNVKVILEGAYNTGSGQMTNVLATGGYLTTATPYAAIFTPVNDITTAATANFVSASIVDWVFVELRSKTNPATVLATRSALLKRDGSVVDVDGVSSLLINAAADDYYIAVRHRNHMAFRSNAVIALAAAPTTVDFTSSSVNTGGLYSRKTVGGKQVMYAGDANRDGSIDASDRNIYLRPQFGTTGANKEADFNLDASVDAFDLNLYFRVNYGVFNDID